MSTATTTTVFRLSDLQDGQEAECFAALVRREIGTTKRNERFYKCYFRDRRVEIEAPVWANSPFLKQAETWVVGDGYRLRARAEVKPKFGLQLEILDIRPATSDDVADGYDYGDLFVSTRFSRERLLKTIHECIEKYIDEPPLRDLVLRILAQNDELFQKIQAASNFHHSYNGGLLEHVWSMTRIAGFLADHYSKYYDSLNPPLNKGVIVAAAILHDIGKVKELSYHPVDAKYTKEGHLIGHVMMGRDMVRDTARAMDGFPEETLLLLEHAILSHHGRKEFGAPVLPQTIEALIVSHIDDLDAKVNIAARHRLTSVTDDEFTEWAKPLERRIYKGVPEEPPFEPDMPPP
jgi:3'-5' exoribonuclease